MEINGLGGLQYATRLKAYVLVLGVTAIDNFLFSTMRLFLRRTGRLSMLSLLAAPRDVSHLVLKAGRRERRLDSRREPLRPAPNQYLI